MIRRATASTTRGRTAVRLATLIVALLAGFTWMAPPAAAHASLVSTSPAQDELLDVAPAEVVVTFNESVSGSDDAVRLFDPAGEQVAGVEVDIRDDEIDATLPDLEAEGSYTVAWKAVSADGHPVAGAYLFHLVTQTLDEPVVAAETTGTPFGAGALRTVGAVLTFFGLTWVAGPWWFGRSRSRGDPALRRRTPWMGAVGGAALLLAGGLWASGGWSTFTSTSSGLAVLGVVALCVIGLGAATTTAAPAIATVALIATALPGHAVALEPVPLSITLTVVHVLAAAVWISGLLVIEAVTRAGGPGAVGTTIRRRSPVLMGAVLLLAASGGWMVVDRVGWAALLDTTYGKLAVAKSVLLVIALVLAAYHRFGLTPLLGSDEDAPEPGADTDPIVGRLRSGVRLELVVVALAVLIGGALGQFNPEGDEQLEAAPFIQRVDFGHDIRAELYVYPAIRGRNDLHLYVFDAAGQPATDIEGLELDLSFPPRDITGLVPDLVTVTEAHVIAQNVQVPFGGNWIVEARGRANSFDALAAQWTVPFATE